MVKTPPASAGDTELWARPWVREEPLEEGMATHSSILPGESHGQRCLVGYSPWGRRESDMTELKELSFSKGRAF